MKKIYLFMITFAALFLLLIGSFYIPDSLLHNHIVESKNYINYYEEYNWYVAFSERDIVLDNTDSDMLDLAIYNGSIGEIGAVKKACYINGYPRFWHGYIVVLRILLIFLNYTEIRYYNMLFLFLILGIDLILISKELGTKTAMIFLLSMCMGRFFITAYCFSYMPSFAISLMAVCIILMRWNCFSESKLYSFFMFIGILENFFDFLTTPLLTWGIPLMVVLLLHLKEDSRTVRQIWKNLLNCSFYWVLGYAGMWFMKWLTGSVILNSNIFADAVNSILFRTQGNEKYPVDYLQMLANNISKIALPNIPWIIFITMFLIWGGVSAMILIKRQGDIRKAALFIFMMLCPYGWYIVLANHSQIHAVFTYKLQIISLFSYFTFILYCTGKRSTPLCKTDKKGTA